MNYLYNSGYALVSVLVVVLLLSVLGGSFAFVMSFELKSSTIHSERLQAYYYARSGAEKGLEWVNSLSINHNNLFEEFFEENQEVYLYGDFHSNSLTYNKDSFENEKEIVVSIKFTDVTPREIEIISKGRYRDSKINEGASIVLKESSRLLPVNSNLETIPEQGNYEETPTSAGDTPDMVSGNSGVIKDGTRTYGGSVLFVAPGIGNSLKTTPNVISNFTADSFYFEENNPNRKLEIAAGSRLTLTSKLIVFYTDIHLSTPQGSHENARLCIKAKPGEEKSLVHFSYDLKYDGNTLLEAGTYYIPKDGICFPENGGNGINTPVNWDQRWQ